MDKMLFTDDGQAQPTKKEYDRTTIPNVLKSPLEIDIEKGELENFKEKVHKMLKLKDHWETDDFINHGDSLMKAVRKKELNWEDFLKALVPLYKYILEKKSIQHGETPLSVAVQKANSKMVDQLLKELPDLKDIPVKESIDYLFPVHQLFTRVEDKTIRLEILKKFNSCFNNSLSKKTDKLENNNSLSKKTDKLENNILHFLAREKDVIYTEEELKDLKKIVPDNLFNEKNGGKKTPRDVAEDNKKRVFLNVFK